MILSTTNNIEGKNAVKYLGLVSGDAILGANIFRDFFASIRDIVGGRSAAYEAELRKAKDIALGEMREQAKNLGANAIVGIDIDYETIGANASMLMVSASGTRLKSNALHRAAPSPAFPMISTSTLAINGEKRINRRTNWFVSIQSSSQQ